MTDPANDIIARFADALVARVISALGEEHVSSVFLGGSVAAGEALWCHADGVIEIFSDVDLYVVVDDGIDPYDARQRAREVGAGVQLDGPGYQFHRPPDVGVYSFEDLASQPARPGTVGLGRFHLMCYGDPAVPSRVAERIGTSIAPVEALYLLENRLAEMAVLEQRLRARPRDAGDSYLTFTLSKAALDAAGASYVVRGTYDPSRSARVRALSTLSNAAAADAAWSAAPLEIARRAGERLERMPAPDWAGGVDPADEADEVSALLLDRWKIIAASELGGDPDDWAALVLRRCRTGDYMGNYRQFRAVNARCRFIRRGAIAAGVHLSRYSPVDALRLSALVDYLHRRDAQRPDVDRLAKTLHPFLDRLTRECGFLEGPLLQRTMDMARVVS